ncbi:MAG: POTRA domain-containing protein [Gemmatimonadota bacterium]|nr:POTRA domain-containing protein [Gemmatimonadota bacterium]
MTAIVATASMLLALTISTVDQPVNPTIEKTEVAGNTVMSTDDIVGTAGLQPGRRYEKNLFDKGLRQVLERYAAQGYLRTEILTEVQFSGDSLSVVILLAVREGIPAQFGKIEISGNTFKDAVDPLMEFDSRTGDPFNAQLLKRDIDRLLTGYEREGYPYCRVEISKLRPADDSIDITLIIHEGPLIRIDGFRVEGNTHTKDHVIIRELRMAPGMPFDQRRLVQGRERLLRLGLFETVSEAEMDVNQSGDGATIVIRVEEGRTSAVDGIIGYMPGLHGRSGFLTGAATLSLQNIAGTGRQVYASWLRRDPLSSDMRIRYEEPWLQGHPITTGFELGQTQQDSSFTATEVIARARMPFTDRINGHISVHWRRIIPDSTSATLLGVSREVNGRIGLSIDSRDDLLNPRRGTVVRFDAVYGIRWNEASVLYTPERPRVQTSRMRIDLEYYVPVVRRHVASIGLHGLDIRSGERILPLAQQFRFGGARTLRGYRENEFRGSRVFWSNAEYRVLLSSRSRFFMFFDAGRFEYRQATTRVSDTKIGYGIGLRLESSLGILGIDYGIGEEDTLLNGKVHFGLRNEF